LLVDDDESNEKDTHIAIRHALSSFKTVEEAYFELSDVQDEIYYHPENEARLKALKDDDGEVKYLNAYNHIWAVMQELETSLLPKKEVAASSENSEFTPEKFAGCLTNALAGINTGISETQLKEILATLTYKK
jgi:hypothetical protein